MTIRDSKHNKHEDEKKEECSRSQIHNSCGETDGDVAEVGHDDDEEVDTN